MNKEDVLEELKNVLHKKDGDIYFHMMATKAYHQLGDLSRDKPDLCSISNETPNYYVGSWVEGFGFFHVLFPKETTRDLTKDELDDNDGTPMAINSTPIGSLKIKERIGSTRTPKKVRLVKMSGVNNDEFEIGHEVVGELQGKIKVGSSVTIFHDDTKFFITSLVTEIISENQFKTRNSIYLIDEIK